MSKTLNKYPNLGATKAAVRGATRSDTMPGAYEIRAADAGKSKKQSMADLKLRRLNELNSRLKEDLERPRIKVSEASTS